MSQDKWADAQDELDQHIRALARLIDRCATEKDDFKRIQALFLNWQDALAKAQAKIAMLPASTERNDAQASIESVQQELVHELESGPPGGDSINR